MMPLAAPATKRTADRHAGLQLQMRGWSCEDLCCAVQSVQADLAPWKAKVANAKACHDTAAAEHDLLATKQKEAQQRLQVMDDTVGILRWFLLQVSLCQGQPPWPARHAGASWHVTISWVMPVQEAKSGAAEAQQAAAAKEREVVGMEADLVARR